MLDGNKDNMKLEAMKRIIGVSFKIFQKSVVLIQIPLLLGAMTFDLHFDLHLSAKIA